MNYNYLAKNQDKILLLIEKINKNRLIVDTLQAIKSKKLKFEYNFALVKCKVAKLTINYTCFPLIIR